MKLQIIFFEKIGTLITNILHNVTTGTVSDKTCFPRFKKNVLANSKCILHVY